MNNQIDYFFWKKQQKKDKIVTMVFRRDMEN